jgi:hypothetical protein
MNQDGEQENTARERIYVKFGSHETDEMPIEWASKILINWRKKQPAQFAKYLTEVVTEGR